MQFNRVVLRIIYDRGLWTAGSGVVTLFLCVRRGTHSVQQHSALRPIQNWCFRVWATGFHSDAPRNDTQQSNIIFGAVCGSCIMGKHPQQWPLTGCIQRGTKRSSGSHRQLIHFNHANVGYRNYLWCFMAVSFHAAFSAIWAISPMATMYTLMTGGIGGIN